MDGQPIELGEVLEGRHFEVDIVPTTVNLFQELARGVDHWAIRTAEVLLEVSCNELVLAGLRAVAKFPVAGQILRKVIAEELSGFLSSSDEAVRVQGISALAELGVADNRGITVILSSLRNDQVAAVRRQAAEALGKLGVASPEAVAEWIGLL